MFNLFCILSLYCNSLDIYLDILFALAVILGISVINSKNPVVSVLCLIGLFVTTSVYLILLGYNFIGLSYLLVYVGAISILFLFILMLINIRTSELINDTSNNLPLALFTGSSFGLSLYVYINELSYEAQEYLENIGNDWHTRKNLAFLPEQETEFVNTLLGVSLHNGHEKNNNEIIIPINRIVSQELLKNKNGLTINKSNNYDLYLSNMNYKNNENLYHVTSNSWDNSLIDLKDITAVGNVLYSTYGIWLILCSIILLLAMIGAITITKKEKD